MLKKKQIECIRLWIEEGEKLTQGEIADRLGVADSTISNWKKNEEFNAAYIAALWKYLGDSIPKALRTMTSLLDAKSEQIRYLVAKDLLDRFSLTGTAKMQVSSDSDLKILVEYGGDAD